MMSSASGFNIALTAALGPITLISGVGLLMICMTARYNHATNRIRQLMAKRETAASRFEPDIDEEIRLIFRRASLLRKGMLCVALSAVFSALLVSAGALGSLADVNFAEVEAVFLVCAIALIVVSSLLFSAEINLSLQALNLAIEHLPTPEKTRAIDKLS